MFRDANPLRKKKKIEDEKKVFGLKISIFHFISIEVYTKWSLKKKVFWGINFAQNHKYLQLKKKVLNTAKKKQQLASLYVVWDAEKSFMTRTFCPVYFIPKWCFPQDN